MKVWSFWMCLAITLFWTWYDVSIAADIMAGGRGPGSQFMGLILFMTGAFAWFMFAVGVWSTWHDAACALGIHAWTLDMPGAACEYEAQKRNTPEKVVVRYTADMWSCTHCGDVQMRNARDIEELHIHE